MADPSSFSTSSSRFVYFVVIPLIVLSGFVAVLNQRPSTPFSWPPRPRTSTAAPPPTSAAAVAVDQPPVITFSTFTPNYLID